MASNTATKNTSFIGRNPVDLNTTEPINDGKSESTYGNLNFGKSSHFRTCGNEEASEEDDDRHFSKVLLHMADGDEDELITRKSTTRKISAT